eukprot:6902201-Pyramimonas_sp.AAC.1
MAPTTAPERHEDLQRPNTAAMPRQLRQTVALTHWSFGAPQIKRPEGPREGSMGRTPRSFARDEV